MNTAIDYDNPPIDADYLADRPLVLTTGTATSIVAEPTQGGNDLSCSARGRRLSCSTWQQGNSGGVLVGPSATLDYLDGALDAAELLILTNTGG